MKVLERDHGLKRAPMELRVVCGAAEPSLVVAALQAVDEEIKSTVKDASITCLVPPRVYRDIVEAVAKATENKGSVEVVERAAVCEASTTLPPPPPVQKPPKPSTKGPVAPKPRVLACNTCGGAFPDAAAHRAHFKSDWHRFNLARKLKQQPPVDEATFTEEQALAM